MGNLRLEEKGAELWDSVPFCLFRKSVIGLHNVGLADYSTAFINICITDGW